ncbi:hypothetical protein [Oscillatoria salina]|uniref:hypothetical protein n=1 Tax=Oscillatoria salina TaxID=331517 RepID=UPI0013BC7662|nr:hypothetical protein [Oscillatoria salina]MBZ8178940.1 hypothetical protein [Oscillatoria salina IIICB1]NET89395.1 hypothetical protein [Kamptonema sp. SIO1D9]
MSKDSSSTQVSSSQKSYKFRIPGRKLTKFLVFAIIGLAIGNLLGQFATYYLNSERESLIKLFDLDAENNLPTWYSSLTLLICSVLLGIVAFVKKRDRDRYTRHWMGLSLIFFLLSIDEAASIHELSMDTLRSGLNASGFLYFTWIVPAAIFVVLLLVIYSPFIKALPKKTKFAFLWAGAIYLLGTLGLEAIGGWYVYNYGKGTIPYMVLFTLEESLEMVGIVIFIRALLAYISCYLPPIEVSFK